MTFTNGSNRKAQARPRVPWPGLAAGLVLCAGMGCSTPRPQPDPIPQPKVTHRLEINRHASAALSASRADAILAEMGQILQTRDGADDVSCNVGFVREGEVGVFTAGTGTINSAQDFLEVNNAPGNVKVVNQINWCGGFAPNIIGCTPLFRDSMIVVRYRDDLEGILWVHEFGHAQGLEHRASSTAVMNANMNPNLRRVNSSECESFRWAPSRSSPAPGLQPPSHP
jgi:hypothetical protein